MFICVSSWIQIFAAIFQQPRNKFSSAQTSTLWHQVVKKFDNMFGHFDTIQDEQNCYNNFTLCIHK